MGKEKTPHGRRKSWRGFGRPLLLGIAAVLGNCGGGLPTYFAGDLMPVAGVCDQPGRATLSRAGTAVEFSPRSGVLILTGKLEPGGEIFATLHGTSAGHQRVVLTFNGALHGKRVWGTYTDGRCRYSASLNAASP